ncbi:MAG: formate dehydrogenase accessory protein FdhE [Spirochaetes bacterium]|nr:formate dehydrogenase accessory protein FdhE [Spirochaetota bacterium]
MQNHKENLIRKKEQILQTGVLDDHTIDFYCDLFQFHQDTVSSITGSGEPPIRVHVQADKSMVRDFGVKKSSMESLQQALDALVKIIARYNPGLDAGRCAGILAADNTSVEKIISIILTKDSGALLKLAETSKTGFEEFAFIVINWLKPFFISARELLNTPVQNEDNMNLCPFCGSYPDMGFIDPEKEGKRLLRCSLCENIWEFKRIACAVCGTEDHDSLEVFTDEDNKRYRIEACHACGGYLKTVKLNKFEAVDDCDLSIENIISASMDAGAMKKGFKRS